HVATFDRYLGAGYAGVDIFFLLSGFNIAYTYGDSIDLRDPRAWAGFLRKRLARLYPVHLVTLLAVAALYFGARAFDITVAARNDYSRISFLNNVFLMHDWFQPRTLSWNYPSWTISAEWAAYLAFPLLAWLLLRRQLPTIVALAALIVVLLTFERAIFDGLDPVGLVRIAAEFTSGVLLFALYRNRFAAAVPWHRLGLPLLVVSIALSVYSFDRTGTALRVVPVFALLVYALAWERPLRPLRAVAAGGVLDRSRTPLLATRPLVYWGKVSYSLYMTHAVTDMVLVRWLRSTELVTAAVPLKLLVACAYVVVIAAVAAATYHWVEEPARRRLNPRRPEPAPSSPEPREPTSLDAARIG
ncbi:MAG: acyltransferase, partial [Thermoleophilia bacterium]|nr:acyltransferase [Thermoleophilia bacterium]